MHDFMKTILSALKEWVNKRIKNNTPNWDENNPDADGYIKNRTHYKENGTVVNVPENTFEFENNGFCYITGINSTFEWVLRAEKIVSWDGVQYNCIINSDSGNLYLGNLNIAMGEASTTGEPFFMFLDGDYIIVFTNDTSPSHRIGISEKSVIIHKIPFEYLPEMGVGEKGTGVNAEIFNDYSNNIATKNYAHAEGNNTKAQGEASHAEGHNSNAIGNDSHAEGYSTLTYGNASHAEGFRSEASGASAHAEGNRTNATGDYAHAEGYSTSAYGLGAHAEGNGQRYSVTISGEANATAYKIKSSNDIHVGDIIAFDRTNFATITTFNGSTITVSNTLSNTKITNATAIISTGAFGDYSHAEGYCTTASGINSHAEGRDTKSSGDYSHAEGRNTEASGDYSHAEGRTTTASGDYSHAEGHYTKALGGEGSHAEGYETEASGEKSHAEGYKTYARGENSHAEGYYTFAEGYSAHAEGYNTFAIGTSSHAEGGNTHAEGQYSHAEGHLTNVYGYAQHVQGKYNIKDTDNKYAHIVGNGTSHESLSNAHTLDWSGNAWYAGNITVGPTNAAVLTEIDTLNFDCGTAADFIEE